MSQSSSTMIDRYGVPVSFNGATQDWRTEQKSTAMTEEEQRERRASIKAIMVDPTISPQTRRLSIQALMDGRRRSSCCGSGETPRSPPAEAESASSARAEDSLNEAAVQRAMAMRMEKNRPPCQHYQRNCSILSPCCGLAFGCRICHDEYPMLPPPFLLGEQQHRTDGEQHKESRYHRSSSMPTNASMLPTVDNQHQIDRFKIAEVICRQCYTRQSSKTNNCINCHALFGEYHCNICNLWMSAEEKPYHCSDCGLCRIGGSDNFKHCHDCGMCIDVQLFEEHDCKVGKYISNCPVCQDDLFCSRAPWHEMPCGHAIHWHCFRELASYDFRCPICKKTADTPDRMIATWSNMALEIALQPLPPELAKVADIVCVDCEQPDEHRKWHFLGVQCRRCSSFNTRVERILLSGPDAAALLRVHGDGPPLFPHIARSAPLSHVGSPSLQSRSVIRDPSPLNEGGEVLRDHNSSPDSHMSY
mmetsp:Transcript_8675/g.12643  ORF Transcript_8675/g.12643 Transcript_8675/m.12643 type:complete len:474 (+) Transcript_8675:221-1642(+)